MNENSKTVTKPVMCVKTDLTNYKDDFAKNITKNIDNRLYCIT